MSRTSVIPLFPQTPLTQENEENGTQSVSQSVTDYSRARAYAREANEIFVEEVADYYCETFGAPVMPPVAKRQCILALEQGLDASLVYTAIDEAALAPRPSWAYAAAILRRLCAEGCFTAAAYEERQERWARRRGRG